jgi:hypothetical protein
VLCDVEKGQRKGRVGMPKGKLVKRDRMQRRACVMEDNGNVYGRRLMQISAMIVLCVVGYFVIGAGLGLIHLLRADLDLNQA